jgi:hypothetical protein
MALLEERWLIELDEIEDDLEEDDEQGDMQWEYEYDVADSDQDSSSSQEPSGSSMYTLSWTEWMNLKTFSGYRYPIPMKPRPLWFIRYVPLNGVLCA